MELAEAGKKFLAEDGAQDGNRQQEQRMAGVDPSLMIGRQSAGGNDGMDMVMGQQVGTPRVQDGEEPDLGTEAFGISERLRAGSGSWPRITGRGMACAKSVPKGSVRGVR